MCKPYIIPKNIFALTVPIGPLAATNNCAEPWGYHTKSNLSYYQPFFTKEPPHKIVLIIIELRSQSALLLLIYLV